MGLRKPPTHMRAIGDEGIAKPPHTSVLALNPKQREQAVQQLYSWGKVHGEHVCFTVNKLVFMSAAASCSSLTCLLSLFHVTLATLVYAAEWKQKYGLIKN